MMKNVHSVARVLAVGSMLAVSAAPATARVDVDVSIGVPGIFLQPAPVYVEPAPVYVQPHPVYMQPYPVYVQPQPIYVQPRPVYGYPALVQERRHGHHGWRHHRHGHRDSDRDGVPNYRDGDRDGDGVSNRDDRRPNDRYRY